MRGKLVFFKHFKLSLSPSINSHTNTQSSLLVFSFCCCNLTGTDLLSLVWDLKKQKSIDSFILNKKLIPLVSNFFSIVVV